MYAECANIRIHRSDDNGAGTLEPQLVKHNGLAALNTVLGKAFATEDELRAYMKENKTDCALRLFETAEQLTMPPYIVDAVS